MHMRVGVITWFGHITDIPFNTRQNVGFYLVKHTKAAIPCAKAESGSVSGVVSAIRLTPTPHFYKHISLSVKGIFNLNLICIIVIEPFLPNKLF